MGENPKPRHPPQQSPHQPPRHPSRHPGAVARRRAAAAAARLSPPAWLLDNLRPQPAPVRWPAVARASVALAVPLAVGFATDQRAYGALVALGALNGVLSDTAEAYRMRILHVAVPQFFAAVGVTLGSLVFGQEWTAVGVLALVALVSGMISSIGAVASFAGLLLLLNAVVGAGLALPDPWWKPPLLIVLGGLFVLALSLLAWPFRVGVPERAAVAGTYRATADLLEASAAPDPEFDGRRRAVTLALNHAYDLLLARRAGDHGWRGPLVRLLAQLNVIIPLVEAAHLRGRRRPPEVMAAVRHLADLVAEGRTGEGVLDLPPPRTASDRAVDTALRHVAAVVHEADGDPRNPATMDDRLGRPAALSVRVRRATRNVLFSEASWRYGLRLALCIGLAQTLVAVIPVQRSYWVALTVTFVLKPDFGSVFSRAVLRALGTAVGLVVAGVVLAEVPIGWWDVLVVALLAPLIPAVSAKGYAFQTAAITPVILLISDVLNRQGFGLVAPRLVDSLIGCAIVLVAGYLLWPESWHTRLGHRLADAVEETADYVRRAFGMPDATGKAADQAEVERTRRRIYRDLSTVRTEFQRALTEPPPIGRRAAAWWPLVVATERIVDATTAARVRVSYGAPAPARAETADIADQLTDMAVRLRSSEVLVEVRGERAGDGEESVLAALRQEVGAAKAIASPGRKTTLA
ncbi:FUSC family protein [Streptomyces sp. NPDC087420]|uniref:FUSC family protein n=1 Tax=Streptomyces sp. NPDC087420 TaxID=3365785 RepID=UPI003835ADDD